MTTIRRMEAKDIEPMVALGEKMWSEGAYNYLNYSADKCRKLGAYAIANPNKITGWVAEQDNEIVGMMMVSINKFFFSDELICNDLFLFVDPTKRKSLMVPIKLITKATQWAKEMGAKEFNPGSSVAIASDKVEKLYRFMKFETVGHLFKKRL